MKLRSIKSKIGLAVGGYGFLIVCILIAYTTFADRHQAIRFAKANAQATAGNFAEQIRAQIEAPLATVRTLAQAFSAVRDPDAMLNLGREPAKALLKIILKSNPDYQAVYSVWEPDAFDLMDEAFTDLEASDASGRFLPFWYRDPDGRLQLNAAEGYQDLSGYYQIVKRERREIAVDPYRVHRAGKDRVIMSLAAPIMRGAHFYGIVGADIELDWLQQIVDQHAIYDGRARIAIISNNGAVAAVSGQHAVAGTDFADIEALDPAAVDAIRQGRRITLSLGPYLKIYEPLIIGQTGRPWFVQIRIPNAVITAEATRQLWQQISISLSFSILAIGLLVLFIRRLFAPMTQITEAAERVALGDLDYHYIKTGYDEIGRLNRSFQKMVDSLKEITAACQAFAVGDFSKQVRLRSDADVLGLSVNAMISNVRAIVAQLDKITHGNYTVDIQPVSESDQLGRALADMNASLRRMAAQSEREDWLKTGRMELNDRMRGEMETVTLADQVIRYVCKRLDAQIGAFFVSTADGGHVDLCGSFAYERRKRISHRFAPGQGLVGQVLIEKKRILIAPVPEDYIQIQSGVGQAAPSHLLVQPLMVNGKIKGVVEIGRLQPFDDQALAFLDQVVENIAIALQSAEARNRMATLLDETRHQAEQLGEQRQALQHSNQELAEQTRALQASEARLNQKQEALRATNDDLQEQAQMLEEQKEDIEQKNIELEMARKVIEQKARDLERTSQYKSEFLANMSHELRTPLNSILLLSKLIAENREDSLPTKVIEFAGTIHASGSDLLRLINDVLDLSKVESGRMELYLEDVYFQDMVESMRRSFAPMAEERGLDFNIHIDERLPRAFQTDRQRSEQIVRNFLSNALKFTEKGQVSLQVGYPQDQIDLEKSGLQPTHTVVFSVKDSGIGIPENQQSHIFEAFRQADGGTSRKYGGTGLGLSISAELATCLGGEIQLHSQPGQGSAFSLYLPLRPAAGVGEQRQDHSGLEALPATAPQQVDESVKPVALEAIRDDRNTLQSGDRAILIIEDDPHFARILADISRNKQFKVLIAGDGETGLHFADYYQPSAIILDVDLPGIDGWAVLGRLKENPDTRHIPVHFISAVEQEIDARRQGAIGYMTKPVSMEQLDGVFDQVKSIIDKRVKRLLLIEDNSDQSAAMRELLDGSDVNIESVDGGKAALDQLKQQAPDCIVLDLGLPDMSGTDLLQAVRRMPAMRNVPIIVYTGKALDRDALRMIDTHAESLIIKGAGSPERLVAETSSFLHRRTAALGSGQRGGDAPAQIDGIEFDAKCILLVDDDMRNVYALGSVLEEKGATLQIAKNGREALDRLAENGGVDLVLMDIMMPVMDGYEAMRRIRRQDAFKALPIIALTAKAMKGDRARCIEAGANDYLAKPFEIDKLLSLLRVWLYK